MKSSLPKNYETVTRRLELIKFLQTPKTRDAILEEFLINRRTLDEDFSNLEKGIDFCGTKLKIKLSQYDRKGRRTINGENYSSSCNPIGLALNMTELYLLTNVIPNQIENDEVRRLYGDIIRKIYPQLSDYALELMGIEDYSTSNKFEIEYEQLKNDVFSQLMYFIKRDKECIIVYQQNGEKKEIKYSRIIKIMMSKLSYSIATLDIIHPNFVVGFRQTQLNTLTQVVSMVFLIL